MNFPTTDTGLKEAGYTYENSGKCKSCHADIAWYRTPKQKIIPLDEGTLIPHWSSCPNAADFRESKPNPRTGPFSEKNRYPR